MYSFVRYSFMINDTIRCSLFSQRVRNGNRKLCITLIYSSFYLKEIHVSGINLNKVEQRTPWSTSMGKNGPGD